MADASAAAEWRALGRSDPGSLLDARRQSHHAAQIIVSAAISYVPAKHDDSHTNLEWIPELRALATNVLPVPGRLRFALRPHDLTLMSLVAGAARSEFPLDGRSVNEALPWMLGEIALDGLPGDRLTTKKHYEIPEHPVATGAAYSARDRAPLEELSNAYHDAWLATSAVQSRVPGASEPRCWPHHFDLATLITIEPGPSPRTIGFGLSPGDDSYQEPYFYVTPYPYPAPAKLPELTLGHWHSGQWVGAVLTVSALVATARGATQQDYVKTFATAAIAACWRALEK
jgi:hypothetical protein